MRWTLIFRSLLHCGVKSLSDHGTGADGHSAVGLVNKTILHTEYKISKEVECIHRVQLYRQLRYVSLAGIRGTPDIPVIEHEQPGPHIIIGPNCVGKNWGWVWLEVGDSDKERRQRGRQ